jgi:predicted ribosomally synthesized peptide with nif11-like leader
MESAKAFVERMNTDEDFKTKITELKDAEARMKYVKVAGFTFTAEDIELVTSEVNDGDLEGIAGGFFAFCVSISNPF